MKYEVIRSGVPAAIGLEEGGEAHFMGDGLLVLLQRDPTHKRRKMQSVVLSCRDLEAMQGISVALTLPLDDGEAYRMGDGVFIVLQRDGAVMQNVAITANDTAAMLAVAA